MSRKLIITEKPSVAREYANILGVKNKGEGCLENDEWVITWCVGHLVTMSYPEKYDEKYKKWNLDDLPFVPDNFLYEVIKDVAPQYKVLKNYMNSPEITTIYYGGDSGREGEYIGRLVRQLAGVRKGVFEKRIWIDSFTKEEILRGMREAKPLSEYDRLSDAAYMRAIEDYLTGINFSRALSCKFGKRYNDMIGSNGWKPLTVGRVMTCVTGMVVERERAIRNFVPTDYFRVLARVNGIETEWKVQEKSSVFGSPVLYNEKGFNKESDANSFIGNLPLSVTVTEAKNTQEKKRASLLYNLAELQSDCSKIYKMSPDHTLEIAQSLYEKKLTTYPRTDARVLSSAVAKEIDRNLSGLKGYPGVIADYAKTALGYGAWKNIANTMYTDDSKITDHYAIIPTGELSSLGALNSEEKNVFELIAKRFIAIFYPAAIITKTTLELTANNDPNEEKFSTSVKYVSEPGYMEVTGVPEKDSAERQKYAASLSQFKEGQKYEPEYHTGKSTTKPPSRYTTGSMILAMENAGNLIEEEELRAQIKGAGIGTSATRAEIIKKLVSIGYLKLDNKTQILTPLPAGEVLYDIIAEVIPELLSPKMTASWELGLDQIATGKITKEKYEETVKSYVVKGVDKIKGTKEINTTYKNVGKNGPSSVSNVNLRCPLCGSPVRRTKVGYGCTAWKKDHAGCDFTLWETQRGKKLTEAQMQDLISKGHTSLVKGFKKKDGGTYDAHLKMIVSDDKKSVKVEAYFDN